MNLLKKLITSDNDLVFVCNLLALEELKEDLSWSNKELELFKNVVRVKETFNSAFDIYDDLLTKADKTLYGKFFSPKWLGRLCAKLGVSKETSSVFDLCCGSGCLLKEAQKYSKEIGGNIEKFWGNDIDPACLAIFKTSFKNIKGEAKVYCSNKDVFRPIDVKTKWDLAIINPPFSMKWEEIEEPCYIETKAPRKCGDWAIIQKAFYYADKVVVIAPSGVWTRIGREGKIREHIIKNNFLEAVIWLPRDCFLSTGINTNIAVLNKNKKDNWVIEVNAQKFFSSSRESAHKNYLTEDQITELVDVVKNRASHSEKIVIRTSTIEELGSKWGYSLALPHPRENSGNPVPGWEEMRRIQDEMYECRRRADECRKIEDEIMEEFLSELKEYEKSKGKDS